MRIRLLILACCAALLAACSGSDSSGEDLDTAALAERLATAQQVIDQAERIDITISTESLPRGVTGLVSASGFGTHAPAFAGSVTVSLSGSTLDADVIGVDGQVWVKSVITPTFTVLDPASIGAPDPASLLGIGQNGIQSLLGQITITGTDRTRDGSDVLTVIEGDLAGSDIAAFLPTAETDSSFEVEAHLDDSDELRELRITGPFYAGGGDVTYTVTLRASTDPAIITAP